MASITGTQLPTRQLGNSDMQLTGIGLGAWAIGGGDWQFSWGHQEDKDSVAREVRDFAQATLASPLPAK